MKKIIDPEELVKGAIDVKKMNEKSTVFFSEWPFITDYIILT